MALGYQLECAKCGYTFEAVFGSGGRGIQEEEIERRFESGKDDGEAALVYFTLKDIGPIYIEADCKPFFCEDCKTLFNYGCAVIYGESGYYREVKAVCPFCGKTLPSYCSVDKRDLRGRGRHGYGECKCRCPECSEPLLVTDHMICD